MFVRLRHSLQDHDLHQNREEHVRGWVGACCDWHRHYNQ